MHLLSAQCIKFMAYSMQMQFSHWTGATRSHKLHMNISGLL